MQDDGLGGGSGGGAAVVRVVSFNVLSSHLTDWFTEYPADHTDKAARLPRLLEMLEQEIEGVRPGAEGMPYPIFCLQEVSMEWAGHLHPFFAKHGYYVLSTHHSGWHSNYMGEQLAIPLNRYNLRQYRVARIGDTAPRAPRAERPAPGVVRMVYNAVGTGVQAVTGYAWDVVRTLVRPAWSLLVWVNGFVRNVHLPLPGRQDRKLEDTWQAATRRYNQLTLVQLQVRGESNDGDAGGDDDDDDDGAPVFWVSNYHMPCMFRQPQVMTVHAALVAQFVQRHATTDPYIMAGDWNFQPSSAQYRLLRQGTLSRDDPAFPPDRDGKWTPDVQAVNSAYCEVHGHEPELTNYAKQGTGPTFEGALDFIFLSQGHWRGLHAPRLPSKEELTGLLPNEQWPSDHLPLSATFELVDT